MSRASELMDSRKFMAAMDVLITKWCMAQHGDGLDEQYGTDEEKAEALQAVLDMAMPALKYGETVSITDLLGKDVKPVPMPPYLHELNKPAKRRGIKALIPVPEKEQTLHDAEEFGRQMGKNAGESLVEALKPKRKRRTKAEMLADAANPEKPKTRAEAKKLFMAEADKLTDAQRLRFKTEDERNTPPDQIEVLRHTIREIIKPAWHQAAGSDGYRSFNVKMFRNGRALSMYAGNWVDALKAEGLPVHMNGQEAQMQFRVLNMGGNGESDGNGKNEKWINVKIA